MKSVLHWKKGIFSKLTTINSADGEIGYLQEHPWKQTAEGEVNNRKYEFRTKGFFTQTTDIYDPGTNYSVGEIKYNSWMKKGHRSIFREVCREVVLKAWISPNSSYSAACL